MKKEFGHTPFDMFSTSTINQIISAYLDPGYEKRELIIQTGLASLTKHNVLLADAVSKFLRIRELEHEIDEHLNGLNPLSDQEYRDSYNEKSAISKQVKENEGLNKGFRYISSVYVDKLKPKTPVNI